ncbi:MAG: 2-oxo acid dehydrogenase subunit E2 [Pseudomonadota bacterium]
MSETLIDVAAPIEQEGTKAVVKSWMKSVGESIAEGEPLVELETDKVAVEVPAPASGVLREIALDADAEAEPGAVLGRIAVGTDADSSARAETPSAEAAAPEQAPNTAPGPAAATCSAEATREHRLSPSVRRLIAEHALDPAEISGTGKDGRLTRADIEAFLAERPTPPAATPAAPMDGPTPSFDASDVFVRASAGDGSTRIPHDGMRRSIAHHMAQSLSQAPHVTAVFEVDFSAIQAHRARHKAAFEKRGVKLTYTTYFIQASVQAMAAAPTVNGAWKEDCIEVFDAVNVGVGVALGQKGLIVPVVKDAGALSLFGISKELQELTEKARASRLAPADVRGGTFTISNHGTSGSLIAAPIIINQPQSAILGVGKLEKRVVVREVDGVDAMQIRPMAYVSLSIDHRVLDGAQTNAWLSAFKDTIENWPLETA